MSKVYTQELEAKIISVGAFTFASATAFAEANGLKPKSLIAKIVQLGLPYESKPKPIPKKVENELPAKKDVLLSVFTKIGAELPSMERMTVSDLMVLDESMVPVDSIEPTIMSESAEEE